VIEETETNQSVYVFKCEGSTIKIREPIKSLQFFIQPIRFIVEFDQ